MQMLNRAIEDAADFKAFRDALTKRQDLIRDEVNATREGENRAQRRARERAERKAAQKTKART
jgi:hypothetical protein